MPLYDLRTHPKGRRLLPGDPVRVSSCAMTHEPVPGLSMGSFAAHGRATAVDGNGAHHYRLDGWGMFQPWEEQAACQDSPIELWFGNRPEGIKKSVRTPAQTKAAKAICARCPVLDACRRWAMESGIPHGLVGMMTEAERRRLLAKGEAAWRTFWRQQDLASGRTGFNRNKTHCPRGHEYTKENTRLYRGSRFCLACMKARSAKYQLRKREQLGQWRWKDECSSAQHGNQPRSVSLLLLSATDGRRTVPRDMSTPSPGRAISAAGPATTSVLLCTASASGKRLASVRPVSSPLLLGLLVPGVHALAGPTLAVVIAHQLCWNFVHGFHCGVEVPPHTSQQSCGSGPLLGCEAIDRCNRSCCFSVSSSSSAIPSPSRSRIQCWYIIWLHHPGARLLFSFIVVSLPLEAIELSDSFAWVGRR